MRDDDQQESPGTAPRGPLDSSKITEPSPESAVVPSSSTLTDPPGKRRSQGPAVARTLTTSETGKDVTRVGGLARDVVMGPRSGEPPMQVLTFRVERDNRPGTRLEPISVEMRGPRIRGAVTEGERVEVRGTWRHGTLEADEVTTWAGSTVRVLRPSKAVKATLVAVTVVVVAGLVAAAVLVSAQGGVWLRALGQGLGEVNQDISQEVGPPERIVPNVIGLKHQEAIQQLRSAGFTQFELDLRGNPSCRVVRTDPVAEQTIPHDQRVVVYSQPSGDDPPGCQ
jgi:PASTA domain